MWDSLIILSNQLHLPWLVEGDFNVILNAEEKLGGLLVYHKETTEFNECINACGLMDIGYTTVHIHGEMVELMKLVFLKDRIEFSAIRRCWICFLLYNSLT